MSEFEILCATMHQSDFSKIKEMNVRSNIVYANQCDRTAYEEIEFDGNTAKMISTQTRGVGKNRNIALIHASANICMLADDDVRYSDDMEQRVLSEFEQHPDADIIIFHLETDSPSRKQIQYKTTRKCKPWEKMPWGTLRAAFRLESIRRANIWFSTLFGGGCAFPSGEDSMWFIDAKNAGLTFYVSKETIGTVCFDSSTWFTGYDEKYYFGKGAFYEAVHPKTKLLWILYFAFRTRKNTSIPFSGRVGLMKDGCKGFNSGIPFEDYLKNKKEL